MANLTEVSNFDAGVYQIETTDPVLGGPGGIANLQAQALANRTKYLQELIQDLVLEALSNVTITANSSGEILRWNGTAWVNNTLAEAGIQAAGSYQTLDATLTALAGLVTAADKLIYATGADTFSTSTLTSFMRTLLDDADAATARATLGAQAAGSYQTLDATLTALAGLVTAADKLIYATGADTFSTSTLTSFMRTLLDDADAATARATLELPALLTPTGGIIYIAGTSAPAGYLKANGAAVSRTTYAGLFTAIGTTFGGGDGSTTFTLPDLRGEFIRGWDDSRGVDSSRTLGSAQADELKSHNHSYNGTTLVPLGGGGTNIYGNYTGPTSSTGGTETRPRNVALLACIKY